MTLGKASWITVVAVCAIGVVVMAVAGYEGYAATTAAVGLAASVNLLPRHSSES